MTLVIPLFFQVSANGNVLRSEIVGSIKMRVFLSGMPELRLGLNDKVLFENTGREFSCFTADMLCQHKAGTLLIPNWWIHL